MKRAVSISIGSSKRDKAVEIDLMGERVSLERIGTDGDIEKAARLYAELDGKVDAFGVGGADLGLMVDGKWYRLHSIRSMVRFVHQTPLVDGMGLKSTLERKVSRVLDRAVGRLYPRPHRAGDHRGGPLGAGRSGFPSRLPLRVWRPDLFAGHPDPAAHAGAASSAWRPLLMPMATRLPFEWVYPVGESQGKRVPK